MTLTLYPAIDLKGGQVVRLKRGEMDQATVYADDPAAQARRCLEIIGAALNLFVFVMMFSSLVYVTQHSVNPKIQDFVDALYFTAAALSTTGFGDVTLIGSTSGELLSVVMMISGISLFLRLVQAVFRQGGKVRYPCPRCGLQRHDHDAVHCKACGELLAIPNDEG